jgi:protein-S-isoprenylcysteine O-methyltransferase Ste14
MAAVVASWFMGGGVTYLGVVPAVLGAGLAAWAIRTMGRSLTPFPTPAPHATLVDSGPFRFLRHPIYVGGSLVFAGLSLVLSAWGLVPTALLGGFWILKARTEEARLLARFPEYAEYRGKTFF